MALLSLLYVSYADKKMTDEELTALLKEFRDKNTAKQITGMLLYRDGFFIQALEGEAEVVEPLFRKISADKRHRNILKVSQETIRNRSFTDWAMGFNKVEDKDLAGVEGYTDFLTSPDAAFFTSIPTRATVFLNSFKRRSYF
mgnify:CR=1 FL=1